jgi:mono/diheme cytochrome c family protein
MTMKSKHLSAWLAAIALAVTALSFDLPRAAADDEVKAGDAAKGKKLYLADGCFECHGRAGQGGRFNYPTPSLAQIELPVDSFIAFLRAAPNDMPAYSADVLSDQDAADIHAYLSSLPGRKPAKDFPLLNQ